MGLTNTQKVMKLTEKRTPIAGSGKDGFFIPNLSGDHSAGKVLTTPTQDNDIANKKYVDGEDATKLDKDGSNADTTIDIQGETLITGDLKPTGNSAQDLGATGSRWKNFYVNGNSYFPFGGDAIPFFLLAEG